MRTPSNLPPGPSHIWIEPTTRCNTRCRHCDHYYRVFGSDMEERAYRKIRDFVLDGAASVDLYGDGEPFLGARFDEMFEDCLRRGIRINLTSNGILLRQDDVADRVARANGRQLADKWTVEEQPGNRERARRPVEGSGTIALEAGENTTSRWGCISPGEEDCAARCGPVPASRARSFPPKT